MNGPPQGEQLDAVGQLQQNMVSRKSDSEFILRAKVEITLGTALVTSIIQIGTHARMMNK